MTWFGVARAAVGPLLLVAVVWLVEPGRVVGQLAAFDGRWLLPIAALSVVQFGVSAWRWRFTARRLGLPLSRRAALADYYLAVFLNQCLPAGVLGDVTRAWRHGRTVGQPGVAAQAVILERVAGQMAFALLALASLPLAPALAAPLGRHPMALLVVAAGVFLGLGLIGYYVRRRPDGAIPRALLARYAWLVQLATSLLVVGTYVAVYVLTAYGLGVDRPLGELIPLIPPVLLAMAVPVSIAGWGVREGAAAAVWTLAGLPPSEGVAVSLAYGVVNLVTALPGLGVIGAGWTRHWRDGASPGEAPAPSVRSNRTSGPS